VRVDALFFTGATGFGVCDILGLGTNMSYYEAIGLNKEPFSTSPDPAFLYLSHEHKAALCRLQIAIKLKRGLSVILGDVGTGKTTLSRRLAQLMYEDEGVVFHMILNPYFSSQKQFLLHLAKLFRLDIAANLEAMGMEIMEAIERYLFQKGVMEDKTVVVLIDEAQTVPKYVLEVLRILLNYETNEYKMLQVILVGQIELQERLVKIPNFWDRIAMKYVLNPLDPDELTRAIEFRLTQAGCGDINNIFTPEAIDLIYKYTGGYPRKVSLLCHNALESLVMHDKQVVDADLMHTLVEQDKHMRSLSPSGAS